MEKMITFEKNNCDCDSVTLQLTTIPLKGNKSASYVHNASRRVCNRSHLRVSKSDKKGAKRGILWKELPRFVLFDCHYKRLMLSTNIPPFAVLSHFLALTYRCGMQIFAKRFVVLNKITYLCTQMLWL